MNFQFFAKFIDKTGKEIVLTVKIHVLININKCSLLPNTEVQLAYLRTSQNGEQEGTQLFYF